MISARVGVDFVRLWGVNLVDLLSLSLSLLDDFIYTESYSYKHKCGGMESGGEGRGGEGFRLFILSSFFTLLEGGELSLIFSLSFSLSLSLSLSV